LGLQQNWWFDGRRDLRESTRAALDYLEKLYASCNEDWMLALAAYNSGKRRVTRAIRRNESAGLNTDFWALKLPRETSRYVPRLLALSQIIKTPEKFGVSLRPVANSDSFAVVPTGGQLEIIRAAQLADMEIAALRAYNAGHRRWATAPNAPPELLLPPERVMQFNDALAALDENERVQWNHYRVERGDSLIHIARRFDTEVQLLKEVNGIRGSRITAGDTMLIPRGGDWAQSLALAQQSTATARGYRVREGDSLYLIAGKFNITIDDIITWNSLDPKKYLQPGQKLTLYLTDG
jgi:membrane-bound lytic murein transglycosylase D